MGSIAFVVSLGYGMLELCKQIGFHRNPYFAAFIEGKVGRARVALLAVTVAEFEVVSRHFGLRHNINGIRNGIRLL
jgi:hypothetical protein